MSTDVQATAPPEEFQHGETIRISVTGRVLVRDQHGLIIERADKSSFSLALDEGVEVERLVPAEGEPQPGDVWRDRYNREWYATSSTMRRTDDHAEGWPDVNGRFGPLTLVHRRESTSDGA